MKISCLSTSNLFIYLFLSLWMQDFLFYSMCYNLLLSLFILMTKLFSIWSVRTPLSWLLWPFFKLTLFFDYFSLFWLNKIFQASLVLTLPYHWNQPFIQVLQASLCGAWCLDVMIQVLNVLIDSEALLLPHFEL